MYNIDRKLNIEILARAQLPEYKNCIWKAVLTTSTAKSVCWLRPNKEKLSTPAERQYQFYQSIIIFKTDGPRHRIKRKIKMENIQAQLEGGHIEFIDSTRQGLGVLVIINNNERHYNVPVIFGKANVITPSGAYVKGIMAAKVADTAPDEVKKYLNTNIGGPVEICPI